MSIQQTAAPVVRETDDVYRVYRPEWVVAHFELSSGVDDFCEPLLERVKDFHAERYAGRVRDDDVKFRCTGSGINAVAQLLLRLPNVKAEFKTEDRAWAYVAEQGWDDAAVVARNSKADHELRQYSIKKLPA